MSEGEAIYSEDGRSWWAGWLEAGVRRQEARKISDILLMFFVFAFGNFRWGRRLRSTESSSTEKKHLSSLHFPARGDSLQRRPVPKWKVGAKGEMPLAAKAFPSEVLYYFQPQNRNKKHIPDIYNPDFLEK